MGTYTVEVFQGDLTEHRFVEFQSTERIAWDIETTGLNWREGQIGTCQLFSPELSTVSLVRITSERPGYLCSLLADERIRKVFPHAPFDLRWMVGHWRVEPASIDCTKVASRLLDPTPDSNVHSLKYLLSTYLHIEISKAQRLTDWLADDLSAEQLTYAANDVTYLLPLLDLLTKDLENCGLRGTYRNCSNFLPTRTRLEVGGWPDIFGY
jgi:ribonuclease D